MANYYFLATLLPPLNVGSPVELGSKELGYLLQQNLSTQDLEHVRVLKTLIDIDNIRSLWQKQLFKPGGNIEQHDLEERLFLKEGLPEYILDYLEQYGDSKERLKNFPSILHRYFAVESQTTDPFMKRYLTFQWQWRLVFVALRARDYQRDLEAEFLYEDPENPFVAAILEASHKSPFEPPEAYSDLQRLYESHKDAPLDLYQALSEWRFNYIEGLIEWDTFSTDRILGYVAQLELCEEWLELDKQKGLEIAEEIMEVV